MKKIKLNQIISLSILIIAGLIAINIYQKQNKKIDQINQAQEEQRKKNELLLNIRDLRGRFEVYEQSFQAKDNREIMNTITNIATDSGVKITSIKPVKGSSADMRKKEMYNKASFNLSIQVDGYHTLGEFISRLENNPMQFIIELLRMSSAGIEPSSMSGELKAELTISKLSF